jgi:3-deoxy-7-phosphoheptulonate synthase
VVSLIPPKKLASQLTITETASNTVFNARQEIKNILRKSDSRLLAIVGPCSIHDPMASLEYAKKLYKLCQQFKERLCILMRVYFEKPRTTVGWKGLINDPHLDGSEDMPTGLYRARQLLLDINNLGLPVATETLDPIVPQYIADLVSWSAIGARTTESQTHREMASGLSMPVGFKNNTDGNLQIAIDAMKSAQTPHSFLGINSQGQTCVVKTRGNHQVHIILRGGRTGANYTPRHVKQAAQKLAAARLPQGIVVDCSHANSGKDYGRQEKVLKSIIRQRINGNNSLIGLMLESNLHAGCQKLSSRSSRLRYGVSITDACINWETTKGLLAYAFNRLK